MAMHSSIAALWVYSFRKLRKLNYSDNLYKGLFAIYLPVALKLKFACHPFLLDQISVVWDNHG